MKRIFLYSFLFAFAIQVNPDSWQEITYQNDELSSQQNLNSKPSNAQLLALGVFEIGLGMISIPVGPVVFGLNILPALYYYCTKNKSQIDQTQSHPSHNEYRIPEYGNDPFIDRGPSKDELLLDKLREQVHQDLEIYEYDQGNNAYKFACERLQAIEHGTEIIIKKYVIEQKIIKDLSHKNCYEGLRGLQIQQVVHQEIIESLTTLSYCSNPSTYIRSVNQIDAGQIQTLSLCARNTLDEACGHNHAGNVDKAMRLVDIGANIVQLVSTINHYALTPIAQGTVDAIKDTTHMFLYPIETATQMVIGITRVSVAIARIIIRTNEIALYELTGNSGQVLKIQASLQQELDPFIEWANHAATLPPTELVRQATRLTWSFILPNKGARALCTLFGTAQVQAQRVAQAMRMLDQPMPVPACCTNVELNIANRTSMLLKNMMGNGKKAFQSALQEIPTLPPMQMLEQECVRLSKLFDNTIPGFAHLKDTFIKIDFEHLFVPKIIQYIKKGLLNNKINGFHHDLNGFLEQMGIIQIKNVIIDKYGCYMADVWFDGVLTPSKTFFPKHWTREIVIKKINEAYQNALQITQYSNFIGRQALEGFTSEGIKIKMIFDDAGKMISAYPINR